jgi:mannose-6-phosphate isomerase-like protein (cupin superfamily)
MKTSKKRQAFQVLATTREGQAAMMTLKPGEASDETPSNEHPGSEQWVFVVSGIGEVKIGKGKSRLRRVEIADHSLLLIEKRERHQIINTGRKPLVTLNFYLPPAYNSVGELK